MNGSGERVMDEMVVHVVAVVVVIVIVIAVVRVRGPMIV